MSDMPKEIIGIDLANGEDVCVEMVYIEREKYEALRKSHAELVAVLKDIIDCVAVTPSGDICQTSDFNEARQALSNAEKLNKGEIK